jgi:sugar phosphate permease
MGIAVAALMTGLLIDTNGWRAAFVLPGIVSIGFGFAYILFIRASRAARAAEIASGAAAKKAVAGTMTIDRNLIIRTFAIIFTTTAIGGFILRSTTFALPKIFDERLTDIANSATLIGTYSFLVFALAAFAQLVVGYLVDRYSIRIIFAFVAAVQAVDCLDSRRMELRYLIHSDGYRRDRYLHGSPPTAERNCQTKFS